MMKRTLLLLSLLRLAVFCICLLLSSASLAVENGAPHYSVGNEDFGLGDFGAPGLYFINTFGYFNNPERKGSGGQMDDVPGGYHVYGINNSFKFNWVTPLKVLGGNVVGIIQPAFGYVHTSAAGRTQSVFSFSDLNFGIALNWRGKTFSHFVEVDSWAPTGHFRKEDIVATGTNSWSVMPMYGFTYLDFGLDAPIPGFEVSGKVIYEFSTNNPATNYRSGQILFTEFLVGQYLGYLTRPLEKLEIAVNGGYACQTTKDTFTNQPPDFDGYRMRQFLIGPAVKYTIGKGFFMAKVLFDNVYDVNRPAGIKVTAKFYYPIF
jgi:hypothetical protein